MDDQAAAIRSALKDVAELRRLTSQVSGLTEPLSSIGLRAHLLVHVICLVLALSLFALEIWFPALSHTVLQGMYQGWRWRFITVGCAAGFLVLLLICLYFITWRSARLSEEEPTAWLERNLLYTHHTAFLSDLFLKFVMISMVIFMNRPDWVSALLIMFTADYLLQRRFFVIPRPWSYVLGVLCMCWGVYVYLIAQGLLVYALPIFVLVTSISLYQLILIFRRREAEQGCD